MQPPKITNRNKSQLDTSDEFFDREFGWVRRITELCPKCKREATMAELEDQGFKGCTYCSYVELLPDFTFIAGGYNEAQKILENLFDERRVEKPSQPRFMPMNFKRNN